MSEKYPNEITGIIVDCAMRIHTRLGPGLYESVYETLLEYELQKAGLEVRRQFPIPVVYDEIKMEDGFRGDLLVNGFVLVEIKSLETLAPRPLQTGPYIPQVRRYPPRSSD